MHPPASSLPWEDPGRARPAAPARRREKGALRRCKVTTKRHFSFPLAFHILFVCSSVYVKQTTTGDAKCAPNYTARPRKIGKILLFCVFLKC